VITQCSIRRLYSLNSAENPERSHLIDIAKSFERRKCGHHELEEPLAEKECFESVALKNRENKHRYIMAIQNRGLRMVFRDVPGVPTIIINRSVMILEPMNEASKHRRKKMEREKFLKGIMDARAADNALKKRKREPEYGNGGSGEARNETGENEGEVSEKLKKKKERGPKGPNPLSVKKKAADKKGSKKQAELGNSVGVTEEPGKKKRKRKHDKGTRENPTRDPVVWSVVNSENDNST
jgi:U3 small nucleolar RNA-associated protein 23